ncbi:N-methylhydantoinase A/oxoprolinase/acetone carboxylase, beta subunit [Sulfobacillus thermosulfidooxidans DSM 9293]|uniref:N-methylhydantoinase A/oxoprolinase/acetone carboxylase, beta subunit n=1 Tax=Sulfobacillus thermosulfidooxidans (strain DSM 9293 / VKM B-1269 / AT-1) TaxID=929705 RepID=A0A1W1WEJ8_SULTA|nr:hydantoinase/oxoprolinase family protein [Sulfobacillus thermosulfidooxidans]SMC04665.1 N-methylhydantoinase A/oxoprolinase/acetone carboxylase, beta subunit [Sulfobacillus thermosulfidooxidans DSM 9293]
MKFRLGIDVGGTNTDAVILDENDKIIAKAKRPVTDDVVSSIKCAVEDILNQSKIQPTLITHAMLGTTQVTNAIIERRRLNKVGLIRIGAPATQAIPPLTGWPEDLKDVVQSATTLVKGGHEFDGRLISTLDKDGIRKFLDQYAYKISAVAVTSVFSPVNADHEQWVYELIARDYPHLSTSLSHEIGSIGLLERENATVLNAAVTEVARHAASAFAQALATLGISAELFLAQNDGTLMAMDYALRFPILTVACGPTNSMRGAAYLSHVNDAVIIDVGGTSSDIGVIQGGFPRQSAMAVEVGGVRTNFRMPDLIALGLGGGSRIRQLPDGAVRVGPDSVGYRIIEEGLVFGGDIPTLTDVAVFEGKAHVGTQFPNISPALSHKAYEIAIHMIEEGIDRIKTNSAPIPLIAVGGGSALLPDRLEGVSEVIRPANYDVANAIGAAIAQVSGRVDRIYSMAGRKREDVLAEAEAQARAEAVRAGADPGSLELVEVEEIPLAYLPSNASRVRVVVAGRLGGQKSDELDA